MISRRSGSSHGAPSGNPQRQSSHPPTYSRVSEKQRQANLAEIRVGFDRRSREREPCEHPAKTRLSAGRLQRINCPRWMQRIGRYELDQ